MISVEVQNAEQVTEFVGNIPQRVRARLREVVGTQTIGLRDAVKSKIGVLFKSGRGPLYQSIRAQTEEQTNVSISGTVGSDGLKYARIQEYGGTTPPHVILPKNGKVLAFMGSGGKMVFARKVNHPGSVIPSRSYLRSSLAERRLEIIGAIRGAVSDGIAA